MPDSRRSARPSPTPASSSRSAAPRRLRLPPGRARRGPRHRRPRPGRRLRQLVRRMDRRRRGRRRRRHRGRRPPDQRPRGLASRQLYHAMAFFYVLGTRDPTRSLASFRAGRAAFDRAIDLGRRRSPASPSPTRARRSRATGSPRPARTTAHPWSSSTTAATARSSTCSATAPSPPSSAAGTRWSSTARASAPPSTSRACPSATDWEAVVTAGRRLRAGPRRLRPGPDRARRHQPGWLLGAARRRLRAPPRRGGRRPRRHAGLDQLVRQLPPDATASLGSATREEFDRRRRSRPRPRSRRCALRPDQACASPTAPPRSTTSCTW